MFFISDTLQWSGRRNETFMSSSGEKRLEVVPVCTGGYEDLVSAFEVDYGWNVVCTMWYGCLVC